MGTCSVSQHQQHRSNMSHKVKVLVFVVTLATVAHLQPMASWQLGLRPQPRFSRDVSGGDLVKQVTSLMTKGSKVSKKAMEQMSKHFKEFDKLLKEADNNIAKIQRELGKVGEVDITREYLDAYWQSKKELRLARTDLRELAIRTTAAVQDIKILIEYWDDKESAFVQKEFEFLNDLLKESLRVLKEAKLKYNNAITNMEKTTNQLSETKTALSLMLEETSTEYTAWTEKVRLGVYGSAAAVTAGMIVADIFGCFGICSGVVTTSTWTGSVAGVETAIAEYKGELEKLETATTGVLGQIRRLEETVTKSIKFLEEELIILQTWDVSASTMKKHIASFSVEDLKRVAAFQKIFEKGLDSLAGSAQSFLNQGAQIFSDNPAQK